MDKFILDIQFVCGNNGQYFIKELAVLTIGTICPKVYHFMPPYPYQELSLKAKRQNNYDVKNINGLHWSGGTINYNSLTEVFSTFENATIYVKGEVKASFIRKYLSTSEIIELMQIPRLSELVNFQSHCQIHNNVPSVRCALQNCINIYLYMLINKIIE